MAKASIIIPIYNVKGYLHQTVNSVISQTERDIEIFLVDDGSTDGSGELCDIFAAEDERIRVIHKENGGLSSARNTGTQAATSEYIMFLDGDDYLRVDAVEILLRRLEQYPCDVLQYRYQEIRDGEEPKVQTSGEEPFQVHTSRELFEQLYRLGGVAASGATKLMKRSLALEIPFLPIQHEDEMWCTQAFQRDLVVTYIPDELYYYVTRGGSIIHSKYNSRRMDLFTVIDRRTEILEKLGYLNLLGLEYRKLFMSVIRLYIEAKNTGDEEAVHRILDIFESKMEAIRHYADLHGKFRMLFNVMRISPQMVELYRWYTNRKPL